jgi:hypothetical protein
MNYAILKVSLYICFSISIFHSRPSAFGKVLYKSQYPSKYLDGFQMVFSKGIVSWPHSSLSFNKWLEKIEEILMIEN